MQSESVVFGDGSGRAVAVGMCVLKLGRRLDALVWALIAGCVSPSANFMESDKSAGLFEQARASIGTLHWSGELWQGERHDEQRPVCLAVLTGSDRILTFGARPSMLGSDAKCLPWDGDYPGSLEFRIGGERARISHVARSGMLMGGRLDHPLTAPITPAATPRASTALFFNNGGSEYAVYGGDGRAIFEYRGAREAELIDSLYGAFELWGRGWDECPQDGLLAGGAVFGAVDGRVFLLGALADQPGECGSVLYGTEATHESALGPHYRALRGAGDSSAFERCALHFSSRGDEESCARAVELMSQSVSDGEAAEVVDACDDAFWLDDEAKLSCLDVAAQSRHPMGMVVRACSERYSASSSRIDCLEMGARIPAWLYECCRGRHRDDPWTFVGCLEERACE